eukprot:m.30030 g.30030  ORF g.30030 m.30030 type:complete len:536 (+) comp14463_c0_seq1:41-1648(+)
MLAELVVGFLAIVCVNILLREGLKGLLKRVTRTILEFPGLQYLLDNFVLKKEINKALNDMLDRDLGDSHPQFSIPEKGLEGDEVLKELQDAAKDDADINGLFAFVYTEEKKEFTFLTQAREMFSESLTEQGLSPTKENLVRQTYRMFQHKNPLNPVAFKSLLKFETETVSMTASMLNGDANVVGCLTSGGTESILSAMKAYRDRARKLYPYITEPEVVAPLTIHPAFEKAAAYFDLKVVHVNTDPVSMRCNVSEMARAINRNTILLAASAPQYPHGVVDPIEEIGALALKNGLPFHVDACFGGFMLPWLEKLGEAIPKFDFRVPGVTSISADIHKYGWGPKGTSVILFKNAQLRQHLFFAYHGWPGGLFASPGFSGSRPGGLVAAAWATLRIVGQDGYLERAKQVLATTKKLKKALEEMNHLKAVVDSNMTSLAIATVDSNMSVFALADLMEKRGWRMERQANPDCLHLSIMPHHGAHVDKLIADLKECAQEVADNPNLASEGSTPMYGMMAKIPDEAIVTDFVIKVLSETYKTQ